MYDKKAKVTWYFDADESKTKDTINIVMEGVADKLGYDLAPNSVISIIRDEWAITYTMYRREEATQSMAYTIYSALKNVQEGMAFRFEVRGAGIGYYDSDRGWLSAFNQQVAQQRSFLAYDYDPEPVLTEEEERAISLRLDSEEEHEQAYVS